MRHRQEKTTSILSTSINGCAQQPSSRKKRTDATRGFWKMKPHVALDWDAVEQKVVSKADQVAISWGHLTPHSAWGHHDRRALADVFQVPPELFQLKNLQDVLTLETWNGCLSASDRQFLRELLPKEVDPEDLVQCLLTGDNFHFGNPLVDWGDALCKGDLHPDSIQQREFNFKRAQKEYSDELERYHYKMLDTLGTLKEIWASCKSTEKELGAKLRRWMKRELLEVEAGNAATNALMPQNFKSGCTTEEKWGFCDKTNNKVPKEDMAVRQRCKKQKIGSLQQALERTDFLPAEESKRINNMMCNAVRADNCNEVMHTLKVSQKQYADIVYLIESGGDLLLDSLSSILDGSQKIGVHRLNGCDKSDTLKVQKFWSSFVQKEIPAAHAAFSERKSHRRVHAKSAAEQCMEQRSQFLCKDDTFICKSSSNISASVISSDLKSSSKYISEHETTLGAEAGKQKQLSASESSVTCMEGQLEMQITVDSCMSSAYAANAHSQQFIAKGNGDSWSKLDEDPVIFTSMNEENSVRLCWNMGEGEELVTQARQHFQGSNVQRDVIAASESELSEDEAPAIKNIWSSGDLDTQELQSQSDGMPCAKEVIPFLSRERSKNWDSQRRTERELNVASGSAESDEVNQRISFQAASFGAALDTHPSDSHTIPPFDNDHLYCFSRHNLFLKHQDPVPNGALFFSKKGTDSSTDNLRLQQDDYPQNKHNNFDARFQPLALCKSSDMNEITGFHAEHDQRHIAMSSSVHNKIEHEQKHQMLPPKFKDQKAHSDELLSPDMSSKHARLASPFHNVQSRNNDVVCETSKPMLQMASFSQTVDQYIEQNHEPLTELRLLVDDRNEEHLGHLQQPGLLSLRTESVTGKRQSMRDDTEQVQNFSFYHQLHQNQHFQDSRQDLYSPCTNYSLLPGLPDSHQLQADKCAQSNLHYDTTGQWNIAEDPPQTNLSHLKIVPGPFSFRVRNEDRRALSALSHWDRPSQSPYIVESGAPKNGQFVGMPRSFSCVSEDWAQGQPFSVNQQHPYILTKDKSRMTNHQWMCVSPGSHVSQPTPQYEQQPLRDEFMSKPSHHLDSPWVCFRS